MKNLFLYSIVLFAFLFSENRSIIFEAQPNFIDDGFEIFYDGENSNAVANKIDFNIDDDHILEGITLWLKPIIYEGDSNLDGTCDVLDVVVILNHILNDELLGNDAISNADLNDDSYLDILDVVIIIQIILNPYSSELEVKLYSDNNNQPNEIIFEWDLYLFADGRFQEVFIPTMMECINLSYNNYYWLSLSTNDVKSVILWQYSINNGNYVTSFDNGMNWSENEGYLGSTVILGEEITTYSPGDFESVLMSDFLLEDINPNSEFFGTQIGPSFFENQVSGYYFGKAG